MEKLKRSPRKEEVELPAPTTAQEKELVSQLDAAIKSQSQKSLDTAVAAATKYDRDSLKVATKRSLQEAKNVTSLLMKLASSLDPVKIQGLRDASNLTDQCDLEHCRASTQALAERVNTAWVKAEADHRGLAIGVKVCLLETNTKETNTVYAAVVDHHDSDGTVIVRKCSDTELKGATKDIRLGKLTKQAYTSTAENTVEEAAEHVKNALDRAVQLH
eukprot:COSAG06_NODE_21418_length_757_cov_1.680851_1_plen_216_part_10